MDACTLNAAVRCVVHAIRERSKLAIAMAACALTFKHSELLKFNVMSTDWKYLLPLKSQYAIYLNAFFNASISCAIIC